MAAEITVRVRVRHAWLLLLPLAVEGLGLTVADAGAWAVSWLLKRLLVIEGGTR